MLDLHNPVRTRLRLSKTRLHSQFFETRPASMQPYGNKRKHLHIKEKSSTPTGFSWYTNKAAVSLFWNTNMATVASSEYVLFQVLPQPILNFLCMMMIRKSLGTRNCHGSLVLWSKRLHRMEGRPAPIQNGSLIGQLARHGEPQALATEIWGKIFAPSDQKAIV